MDIPEISNVLACDVGNSGISAAHVCGEVVRGMADFSYADRAALGDKLGELWRQMKLPKIFAASSVSPEGLKIVEAAAADKIDQPLLAVGRDLPPPMKTTLAEPAKIGTDRLCAAVAAFDCVGQACVVADFGSAITIDCVNDEGVFLGGAILPGLAMGAKALHEWTAALPHVKLDPPDWVFGADTRQAIVGGLVYGARGALRHFVESYATKLGGWPIVVITGGDAKLICPDPNGDEIVQAVVPDLVLRGIAMAYYNTTIE
ncbi:MAG: type III pantothenate kinase [Planctomycetes bacterium]|nr:type III pantothenate kinase [Planctomycetota bacterium]